MCHDGKNMALQPALRDVILNSLSAPVATTSFFLRLLLLLPLPLPFLILLLLHVASARPL